VYRPGVLERTAHALARELESGSFDGPLARVLARAHAAVAARTLARPLRVPDGIATVAVGGATLGGSGKTRVALACARALVTGGARVVLVGHGYRSRVRGPRVVDASATLANVGDEALACARTLAAFGDGGRVVVAGRREDAVEHACRVFSPEVVVIDGPLQLAPRRASLSLLAVDAHAPWGSGHVAPAGDLRASRSALLAHADLVVPVDAAPRTVRVAGRVVPLAEVARMRTGLFTAIARTERLERALAASGVRPEVVVRIPDHGPLRARARGALAAARVDVWLATPKCATHLDAGACETARVGVIDDDLELGRDVLDALGALVRARPGGGFIPHACLDPLRASALVSL